MFVTSELNLTSELVHAAPHRFTHVSFVQRSSHLPTNTVGLPSFSVLAFILVMARPVSRPHSDTVSLTLSRCLWRQGEEDLCLLKPVQNAGSRPEETTPLHKMFQVDFNPFSLMLKTWSEQPLIWQDSTPCWLPGATQGCSFETTL